MAINPNTNFSTGAVLTADQQNRFPRGVMALATSETPLNITTTRVVATGMTVTFTAAANRYYKVTYYEPLVVPPSVSGAYVALSIRDTNASGTQYMLNYVQTNSATNFTTAANLSIVKTFSAGSVTLVGCVVANTTTGTPNIDRGAVYPSYIIVEDVGGA